MSGFPLKNKLAFITGGAGQGLGREFARRILDSGGLVCLADIKAEAGEATRLELALAYNDLGTCVHFVRCDVTSADSLCEAMDEALAFFERDSIDVMVNNAGVIGAKENDDWTKWSRCLAINQLGCIRGTELALERMQPSGVVVNVSSILGLFNAVDSAGWDYNVAKNSVVTFGRCVGGMLARTRQVRVLTLCPSVTNTPILDGMDDEERREAERKVGGIMEVDQVGDAFLTLLDEGAPGSVMSVWNKCPPTFLPDVSMQLFIFYTVCSMVLRYVPGIRGTRKAIHVWHIALVPVTLAVLLLANFLYLCLF